MAQVDESLVGNPLIFPTQEDLAATFAFMSSRHQDAGAVRQGLQLGDRGLTQ